MPASLPKHHLKIVLVEPEIPQNTGNIARLCAVTGAQLHLVRPLGFLLAGRHLKRAGMDYLDRVHLTIHDNLTALRNAIGPDTYWLTSARANKSFWEASYHPDDWLVFGRETAGLPPSWLAESPRQTLAIPMLPGERSLNLATAVGVILFETLRQLPYN